MDNSLRVCIDKVIPGREPPQYVFSEQANRKLSSTFNEVERAAIVISKMWPQGKTLRIRFLDGDPEIQDKVKEKAMDWANSHFI